MRRVVDILASLAIVLALSSPLAAEQPQFTPEQHELASVVVTRIGEEFLWVWEDLFTTRGVEIGSREVIDLDERWREGLDELRPMLKVELLFARKVCGLSEQDFQLLTEASEAAMKERVLPLMLQELEPDESNEPPVDESVLPRMAQAAVSQAAECLLTAQQFEMLTAELRTRTAFRKRVTIQNLVVRLDTDLHLSPNQQEKFARLFETHWKESWSLSLSALTSEYDYMPTLPEDQVFAILSVAQQEAFKTHGYSNDAYRWDYDTFGLLDEQEVEVMDEAVEATTSAPDDKPDDKRSDD